ncbi:Serine--tRNA ligase, partial [Stegodyphus mimosarum]
MARRFILDLCPRLFALIISRSKSQFNVNAAFCNSKNEMKNKISTLFVPGRHGGNVYQIVKPVIDINFISDHILEIKRSCELRGIEFDPEHTFDIINVWSHLKNRYQEIVEKEEEYQKELERLQSLDLETEIKDITEKRIALSQNLRLEKEKLYDVEDIVMPKLQKIPNLIDAATPTQFDTADICQKSPDFEFKVISHAELGKLMSLLEFSNNDPTVYYMKGKLSELELATQIYFSDKLISLSYAPLSCVDFCKSFIIEAVGLDPHSNADCIPLKSKSSRESGQKLNLVGGASLEMFCAYLTNMNVDKSSFPLRYYSLGRRYNAQNRVNSQDLFSVVQSTNIHSVILCDQNSEKEEFSAFFNSVLLCYQALGLPYRTVDVAAKNLIITESRRKQLELWSPSFKKYVPVAHVSQRNNFLSKRLHITYGIQHSVEGYCSIVDGIVVNIPVLIACIMENFQTKNYGFEIPPVLKEIMDNLYA